MKFIIHYNFIPGKACLVWFILVNLNIYKIITFYLALVFLIAFHPTLVGVKRKFDILNKKPAKAG